MMLLVFGACGNGGQKQETKEDKTETEATTVTSSPDLVFFDLRGPVKSCAGVEFDRSGKVTSTTEYYYTDIDDHGNWTRRTVKDTDAISGYVNETEETREIEYY